MSFHLLSGLADTLDVTSHWQLMAMSSLHSKKLLSGLHAERLVLCLCSLRPESVGCIRNFYHWHQISDPPSFSFISYFQTESHQREPATVFFTGCFYLFYTKLCKVLGVFGVLVHLVGIIL